ncbi:hypothetical protein J4Q44_G00316330 [Coregonus suidteri]|uniref:Uncharacterized protein n=1 Tax=Coregonus suidteri TaxID=861788 RepID=A0AAN8QIR2_9TELE
MTLCLDSHGPQLPPGILTGERGPGFLTDSRKCHWKLELKHSIPFLDICCPIGPPRTLQKVLSSTLSLIFPGELYGSHTSEPVSVDLHPSPHTAV